MLPLIKNSLVWLFISSAAAILLITGTAVINNHQLDTVYAAAVFDHTADLVKTIPKAGWQNTEPEIRTYLPTASIKRMPSTA
jgi:hypothetical protein